MDKALLLAPRLATGEVELPGVGTVVVRGLSRFEMVGTQRLAEKGVLVQERAILALGMVDPEMTEDEVAQWQKASPANEINLVAMKINELSGIKKGAAKSDVPADGAEPRH